MYEKEALQLTFQIKKEENFMKNKKQIALVLAAASLLSMAAGCGGANKEVDGKINLKVGLWPDETQEKSLEKQNQLRDEFMEAHTDINIIPDTYKYDTKTFNMKANANQLPNMFKPWFTEIKQLKMMLVILKVVLITPLFITVLLPLLQKTDAMN